MSMKYYRYHPGIQRVKLSCKFGIALFILILIFKHQPTDYNSITDYTIMIIGAPVAILFFLYFIGSWGDIGIHDEGLRIEFFGLHFNVPWSEILGIKYFGLRPFGYWIVITKRSLTPFHVMYGLGALTLHPSFHIHPQLDSHRYVLKIIRQHLEG